MEKQFYSAFTETTLHPLLQQIGVQHLVICGVTANNCVTATVRDAFHLGYDVVLPSDGVAQTNPKKLWETLNKMAPYCHAVVQPGESLSASFNRSCKLAMSAPRNRLNKKTLDKLVWDGTKQLSGLGAGDSLMIPNFLPEDKANEILQNLLSGQESELQWSTLQHVHHGSDLPRLTAYQSEPSSEGHLPAYRCADPQPWHGQYETTSFTTRVKRVKQLIEEKARHRFNWSRILCYRDGKDGMGFHSDKCLDLREGSFIASLSLGQSREYELKPKALTQGKHPAFVPQKITLRHNTLLLLGPESNRLFLHSIKKDKSNGSDNRMEPRVSITFRDLATWYVDDGLSGIPAFYGQGTRYASFKEFFQARRKQNLHQVIEVVSYAGLAFLAVSCGTRKEKRSSWIGVAAAEVAAVFGILFVQWKHRKEWEQEQHRLAHVYRRCNIQALTPAQAKELLLRGSKEELSSGTPKSASVCARDS